MANFRLRWLRKFAILNIPSFGLVLSLPSASRLDTLERNIEDYTH
jgi:hypothetical protein